MWNMLPWLLLTFGKVEIAVTYNKGKIDSARVRPLSYDIPFTIEGNTLQFSLEKPANLSVEVNGDIFITCICLPIPWIHLR